MLVLAPGGDDALDEGDVGRGRRLAGRRRAGTRSAGRTVRTEESKGSSSGSSFGTVHPAWRTHDDGETNFGISAELPAIPACGPSRPKIIRPAGVCSTLVTVMVTSWPMWFRPCSTTTIV